MRDQPTIDAKSFFGEPFDDVRRRHRFHLRLGQGFALFLSDQDGDIRRPLPHQAGGAAHDPAALGGHGIAPYRKAMLRGVERPVEVGTAGMRDPPDLYPRRRVLDGQ